MTFLRVLANFCVGLMSSTTIWLDLVSYRKGNFCEILDFDVRGVLIFTKTDVFIDFNVAESQN